MSQRPTLELARCLTPVRHLTLVLCLVSPGLAGAAEGHASLAGAPAASAARVAPAAAAAPMAPARAAADGRVVVLGFDGADWRTTERLMAEGQLPNLAKLAAEGTAGPLVSTDPAESAAGWAAINTGANPAKNGVASFIKRSIIGGQPSPDYAHVRQATVATSELEPSGLLGLFVKHGRDKVALGAGVGAFLVLLLAFKLLLRAGNFVAVLLSGLVGAGVGFGAWRMGAEIPSEVPGVWQNQVELDGFWIHAARAGQQSVALDAALSLGRPGAEGARTLYGLGLPDLRGGSNGEWFLYTTDELSGGRAPKGDTSSSKSGTGTIFRVDWKGDSIETQVFGPLDFVARDRMSARLTELQAKLDSADIGFNEAKPLRAERDELKEAIAEFDGEKGYKHRVTQPLTVQRVSGGGYDVTLGNTTQRVASGAWSDMYSLRFDLSPLVKAHAVTRVRVVHDEPFELYVDSLHIDPEHQAFWQPVTQPQSFGAELVKLNGGTFETLGWGCMTNQQKDELMPVEAFLEDVEFTHAYRRRLTQEMLKKRDWRLLFSVFTVTDRVQHILYRCYDPLHPMHDAEEAARKVTFFGEEITLADAVPAIYRQMDRVVGEVLAALAPEDTLMLCADHGFTSYRRGLVVNNWLAKEGFLTLKDDLSSTSQRSLSSAIDWSRTQAYSLGLGMVYLNLQGREPAGIVTMEEADGVLARIQERFQALKDGEVAAGASARKMPGMYDGPDAWGSLEYPCADLMLGMAEFYRVAWTSVSGNLRLVEAPSGEIVVGDLFEDNDSNWSGDHASNDPNVVTGIFFANRKVRTTDAAPFSVLDIAPTVLGMLGAPQAAEFDRPSLVVE
ncbi:MAG: alkaline phosphatase family protein [Planctomycetota bacterium]